MATTFDWYRIMYAWMALQGSAFASLYFIVFHMVANVVVFQLTTALFIDAFLSFDGPRWVEDADDEPTQGERQGAEGTAKTHRKLHAGARATRDEEEDDDDDDEDGQESSPGEEGEMPKDVRQSDPEPLHKQEGGLGKSSGSRPPSRAPSLSFADRRNGPMHLASVV